MRRDQRGKIEWVGQNKAFKGVGVKMRDDGGDSMTKRLVFYDNVIDEDNELYQEMHNSDDPLIAAEFQQATNWINKHNARVT